MPKHGHGPGTSRLAGPATSMPTASAPPGPRSVRGFPRGHRSFGRRACRSAPIHRTEVRLPDTFLQTRRAATSTAASPRRLGARKPFRRAMRPRPVPKDDELPACPSAAPHRGGAPRACPPWTRRSLDRDRLPLRHFRTEVRLSRGFQQPLPRGDVSFRSLPVAAPKRASGARGSRYAGPAFDRRSLTASPGRNPERQRVRQRPLPRATSGCAPSRPAAPKCDRAAGSSPACRSRRPRPPRPGRRPRRSVCAVSGRGSRSSTATWPPHPEAARTPKRASSSGLGARASPAIPAALPHLPRGPKPVRQAVSDSSSSGRRTTSAGASASPKRDPAAGFGRPPVTRPGGPPTTWPRDLVRRATSQARGPKPVRPVARDARSPRRHGSSGLPRRRAETRPWGLPGLPCQSRRPR